MNFPAQNGRILGLDWRNLHMSCRIIVRLAEFTNYHTHRADLVLKYMAPKSLKDELLIASLQLFNYYNKDSKRQQINRNNLNKRSYLMLCTVQLLDKMYIIIIFIQIRELNLSPSLKSAYSPVLEG